MKYKSDEMREVIAKERAEKRGLRQQLRQKQKRLDEARKQLTDRDMTPEWLALLKKYQKPNRKNA